MITIYQYNTEVVRATIDPDTSSKRDNGIMRAHQLTLTFTDEDYIDFQIGDYCFFLGNLFRLYNDAEWNKTAERNYSYTLTMGGVMFELTCAQYLTLNANNHFTEGKFSLRGKPVDFCNLIISNMNRAFPGLGWSLGAVIDGDYLTIDFESNNCLEAIGSIADKYETEYQFIDRKIYFGNRQPISGVTLEYGQGKSLYSIGRSNQDTNNIVTRLYAYGSNKNIGDNYRNGAPRLRMADSLYIEKDVDKYGLFEFTKVFDGSDGTPEVYPHRTGTISAVTSPFIFTDNAIDFNVNDYLIGGVTAQLTFNTGLLAGITFDIHEFDNDTKTFTINANTDDQTATMPSADFTPAVGDEYVLTDITQPLSYVNDAETELLQRAIQWLNDSGGSKFSFPVGCNDIYFKANTIELTLGASYRLLGAAMGIDRQIRLTAYSQNVRNPAVYTSAELADTVTQQLVIVQLINNLKNG